MKCSQCGSAASAEDRFCGACGAPLSVSSSGKGSTSIPPLAKSGVLPQRWVWAGFSLVSFTLLLLVLPLLRLPAQQQSELVPLNLIGKTYMGNLPIPGWEGLGGGALGDLFWYHLYRRADGAFLVLLNRELPRLPGSDQAVFKISDAIVTAPFGNDIAISVDCDPVRRGGINRVFAAVRVQRNREWYTDVRAAWAIQSSGRWAAISKKGVRCRLI